VLIVNGFLTSGMTECLLGKKGLNQICKPTNCSFCSVLILESCIFFVTNLFLGCRKQRRPPRWNWELEPLIPTWTNGWRYISGHELLLEMRIMIMADYINSLLPCRVLHLRKEANPRSRCEAPETS
jgi:hypothetical protein